MERLSYTLAELDARGHNNNFNVLRLLAAWLVVFSHSYPLTGGLEPFLALTGASLGGVALDMFFLTSGYLVTKSLLLRQDFGVFLSARVLRIYPGLVGVTLLTVAAASIFSPPGFLWNYDTGKYIVKNAFPTIRLMSLDRLPGLFENNPFPRAVNGSLWTMPYELRMYVGIVSVWLIGGLVRFDRTRFTVGGAVAITIGSFLITIVRKDLFGAHLMLMFFTGATFYGLRSKIRIDGRVALTLALVLLASLANRDLFYYLYEILFGYVLFAAAYLPRLWRPTHDYSYGTYIYAFPVQQTIAANIPGIDAIGMFLVAIPFVFLLAMMSWHLIEKPAQGWRRFLSRKPAATVS